MQYLFLLVLAYFGWQWLGGGGCDAYASEYSCSYVQDKATYSVYYWRNVEENDPKDDEFIGTAQGLASCRAMAVNYQKRVEPGRSWNNRSYICVLMDKGRAMEKHRL